MAVRFSGRRATLRTMVSWRALWPLRSKGMGQVIDMGGARRGYEARLEALAKIRVLQEDEAPEGEIIEALKAALVIFTTAMRDTR